MSFEISQLSFDILNPARKVQVGKRESPPLDQDKLGRGQAALQVPFQSGPERAPALCRLLAF
jgi:hypothetical protein